MNVFPLPVNTLSFQYLMTLLIHKLYKRIFPYGFAISRMCSRTLTMTAPLRRGEVVLSSEQEEEGIYLLLILILQSW
jgi:hypothetical protein